MKTRLARRIRSGLDAAAYAEMFRGHFTHQAAIDHHRKKLTSPAALIAFDRAVERVDDRAFKEQLRISIEFASIINRNFQETP